MHFATDNMGTISGVLYRGDVETKYSKLNNPSIGQYLNVRPYDMSLITQVPN